MIRAARALRRSRRVASFRNSAKGSRGRSRAWVSLGLVEDAAPAEATVDAADVATGAVGAAAGVEGAEAAPALGAGAAALAVGLALACVAYVAAVASGAVRLAPGHCADLLLPALGLSSGPRRSGADT